MQVKREIPPRPIVGLAKVVEKGFDTDEMMRYVVYEFDPPCDGDERRRILYGAVGDDDGLPVPMSDERERMMIRQMARSAGYQLDE